ncbi:MAG: type II toxin-antitoxin system VapC family toxin [Anaerolineae bacterium]
MPKYLLDTNVISEYRATRPDPKVMRWLGELDPASIYLSVITIGEIKRGIGKLPASKRRSALARWLEDEILAQFEGRVMNITTQTMLVWGELLSRLDAIGRSIAGMDSLIAAIALENDLCLVTRNDSDFRDTGIQVINPWKLEK